MLLVAIIVAERETFTIIHLLIYSLVCGILLLNYASKLNVLLLFWTAYILVYHRVWAEIYVLIMYHFRMGGDDWDPNEEYVTRCIWYVKV